MIGIQCIPVFSSVNFPRNFTPSKLYYYSSTFSLNNPFNNARYLSVTRGQSFAQRFHVAQLCIQLKQCDFTLLCTWNYFLVSVLYFCPFPFCRKYTPALYRIVVLHVPQLTNLKLSSNFSTYSILVV